MLLDFVYVVLFRTQTCFCSWAPEEAVGEIDIVCVQGAQVLSYDFYSYNDINSILDNLFGLT